jgi:hypothetical protein
MKNVLKQNKYWTFFCLIQKLLPARFEVSSKDTPSEFSRGLIERELLLHFRANLICVKRFNVSMLNSLQLKYLFSHANVRANEHRSNFSSNTL